MDEDAPIVYRIGELWHVMVPFGPDPDDLWLWREDDGQLCGGSNLRRR